MGRFWEKTLKQAQDAVAATGHRPEPEPMTPEQIESFVKGFGLSAAACRQVVSRWTADQQRAYSRGHDDAAEDYY